MTLSRVVSVERGLVMVVTDLHGDWDLYQRYRDVFLALRERGLVDTLIFTGDLIHSEGPSASDKSLAIMLDLVRLRAYLEERLIVLLGNHELPHIYHITLAKGNTLFTPRFEHALGDQRDVVLAFLESLPFYVRTRAGVAICHAGAFPEAAELETARSLLDFSHRALLDSVAERLPQAARPALRVKLGDLLGASYDVLVRHDLAVSGPGDPRYDDFLIGQVASITPEFTLLWSALFSKNERQYAPAVYTAMVEALLHLLSGGFSPQRVLVTGHVRCRDGYRVLAQDRQLRIASGVHALPYHAARYLLFDAARPVTGAGDLVRGLGSVFAVAPSPKK
ncbi:MAG: metallophosphoesterase [Anaerolineae bacterium]|nr:metallophosphoesterase [Anaerolineae bacterium]